MNSKTKNLYQYSSKTKSPLPLSQSVFFLDFNFNLGNTATSSFLTPIRLTYKFCNILALASKTLGYMREEIIEKSILLCLHYGSLSFLVNSNFKIDFVDMNLLTL